MMPVSGQATAEYAGLLALAAVLGATLTLVAGPPLAHALRDAFAAALGSDKRRAVPVATAADIADVQSAMRADEAAVTPDAALMALARRGGPEHAREIADALVLAAARNAAPWLGTPRTYRAWRRLQDGPYMLDANAHGDRDVETPTGPPAVTWVTVAAQRLALATAFEHHTRASTVALDALGVIPLGRIGSTLGRTFAVTARRLPQALDGLRTAPELIDLTSSDDGGVPAGLRSGDVVVDWPVHRTYWRDGREDTTPLVDLGGGLGSHEPARDYRHLVVLRPGAGGLAVVAEGFGT